MKKIILGLLGVVTLISCSKKIDGTDLKTYMTSFAEIKEGLSIEEGDSLSKSLSIIISKSGYNLLEIDKIANHVDGMTAEDVFVKAESIREERRLNEIEKQRVIDSTRQAFVTDSIAKYEKMGLWEIKHFVDEFQQETKDGYVVIASEGVFSNSATNNSKLLAKTIIGTNGVVNMFLFEYGSNKVKTVMSDANHYAVKIKCEDKVDVFAGEMYDDRISFEKNSEVLSILKNSKDIKVLIEERSQYGYGSKYLFDADVTNLDKALKILN